MISSPVAQIAAAGPGALSLLLLLQCGDVEPNPGPRREPKPDKAKIVAEKVEGHEARIAELESLLKSQSDLIEQLRAEQVQKAEEFEAKQVESAKAMEQLKVESSEAMDAMKVESSRAMDQIKVDSARAVDALKVELDKGIQTQKMKLASAEAALRVRPHLIIWLWAQLLYYTSPINHFVKREMQKHRYFDS